MFIDATIVRLVMVPATMELLGRPELVAARRRLRRALPTMNVGHARDARACSRPLVKARTWKETLHLLLDMPVRNRLRSPWRSRGCRSASASSCVMLIGVVILGVTVLFGRLVGNVERARAAGLLDLDSRRLDSPSVGAREGVWRRSKALLTDAAGWKGLVYSMVMLPVGIVNFTVAVTLWSVAPRRR